MHTFFAEQSQISNGMIKILGDDAKHISFSLRMAKGDHITVCNNQRKEYDCVLTAFDEGCVTAEIVEEREAVGESPLHIILYQGLPKGDKLDTVIQKAVECGVTEIVPFESERCIAKAKAEAEARKTERRNRIAIEAAKQCGRGCIPEVHQTVSFECALQGAKAADLCLICYEDEDKTTIKQVLKKHTDKRLDSVSVLIGSEGGFSPQEIKKAIEAGMIPVSLGKRILRTETAPVFVLSCLSYEFEL